MNAFALSGLLTGISSLAFGFLVYFRERGRTLNKLWFIFTISVALWGFGSVWIALATTPKMALLAWRVSFACGVIWIPILFYHFVSVFCEIRQRRFLIFNYAIGVIFFPLIFNDLFFPSVRFVFSSFYYAQPSKILYVFVFWWIGVVSYSHLELVRAYKSASGQKRLQIRYFFLATFIGYIGGSLNYLPIFGADLYPWGNFGIVVYPIMMTYAIARFRLMDVSLVLNKGLAYLAVLSLIAIPTSFAIVTTQRATPYSVPPLVAATFIFCCGLWIGTKNPRKLPNRTFALICLAVSDWLFFLFLGYSASTPQEAILWMKMIYVGVLYVPPLFFHFVDSFTERKTRLELIYLSYGVSTLFLLFIPTDLFISGLYHYPWGYYAKAGALHTPFLFYFAAMGALSLKRLYHGYWMAKENDPIQAIRIKYVFWAFVVGYGSSIDFVQVYGVGIYPAGYVFATLWTMIVTYAIAKYRVMDISVIINRRKLVPAIQAIGIISLYFVILGLIWLLAGAMLYSLAGLLLAVFVLAAGVLHSARLRVEKVILKTLWKETYEAYERLERTSQTLVTLLDPKELTRQIVLSLSDAFSLRCVSLYLQDERGNYAFAASAPDANGAEILIHAEEDRAFFSWLEQRHEAVELEELAQTSKFDRVLPGARSYFARVDAAVCLPLVHNRRLVGIVNLSAKLGKSGYTQTDMEILDRFSVKASLALSNALAYGGAEQISQELQFMVEQQTEEIAESKEALEQSYQKLKELDKLKSQFFANISHELRTPLTLILAPLENEIKRPNKSGENRKRFEMMYQNGLRLLRLINNLLDLAKFDDGKPQLFYTKGDYPEFLKGIIASVSPLAEKKEITLSLTNSSPMNEFYFDRDKIEKIMLNIVFNSLKFTKRSGSVHVTCERKENQVWVKISDTGIGIAKENIEKLFNRFSQIDPSASRQYEGTGIGLALTKELVSLHKGEIWAESDFGQGTTITFAIPYLEDASIIPELSVNKEDDWTRILQKKADYSASGMIQDLESHVQLKTDEQTLYNAPKILVVEDNPDMLEFLISQLEGDYKIITARNGEEGIQRALAERPSLILSDVMMPIKDGFQLCKEVKENPAINQIPIILITAKADLSAKVEGLQYGADDYLTKPFSCEELGARIKSLLNLRELEAQLIHSEKMAAVGLLIGGVVHEVNNPLSFAKMGLSSLNKAFGRIVQEMARVTSDDNGMRSTLKDIPEDFKIVSAGLERIEKIIFDLKTHVRKDEETFSSTDLHAGLDSTLNLMQGEYKDRVRIAKDYGEIGFVDTIPGQINQVFVNLLQNGIQSIPGEGEIRIKTWKEEDFIKVSIKDTGAGIHPENLKKIYQPFFTTKEPGKGTGLGLWICDRIIQKHKGKITVESQVGRGTTMTLTIPIKQV